MRALSCYDAGRSLPELMQYVNDSGQAVKIVRTGGCGACAIIGYARLEALTQQLKRVTEELDALS